MRDRVFIDTNIFVYAFLEGKNDRDYQKHIKAKEFLQKFAIEDSVYISTQVCNEYYSALIKHKVNEVKIQNSLRNIVENVNVASVSLDIVMQTFEVKNRYGFSYWDSLILSSALENGCSIVYSEDMQDKQIIFDRLKIINPL